MKGETNKKTSLPALQVHNSRHNQACSNKVACKKASSKPFCQFWNESFGYVRKEFVGYEILTSEVMLNWG